MSLYLSQVVLSQFRSFKELDVRLHPGPGVLIVHGTNGLGKSSLFDALEWALTDRIDHFSGTPGADKPGTYLCRWNQGSRPEPARAALTFSDGRRIERSLARATAKKSVLSGDVADIAAYLRDDGWDQPIASLTHHLLLTHFLGQSIQARLTHRKPSDRFDMLREAARSSGVKDINDALYGEDGKARMARAYGRSTDLVRKEANILAEELAREERLWGESRLAGAIDDNAAAGELSMLLSLVHTSHAALAPAALDGGPTIEGVSQALVNASAATATADALIGRARRLAAERTSLQAQFATHVAAQGEARERVIALSEAISSAKARQQTLVEQGPALQTRVENATRRSSRMFALQASLDVIVEAETSTAAAQADLGLCEQQRASVRTRLARFERRDELRQRLTAQSVASALDARELRDSLARLENAERVAEQRAALETELAPLTAHPDIEAALALADQTHRSAEAAALTQNQTLARLRDAASAMAAAVAAVAAHLHKDDRECPVCLTEFPDAAVLRDRVKHASDQMNPAIAAQERQALTAQIDERNARDQRDILRLQWQQIVDLRGRIDAAERRHRELAATAGLSPDANAGTTERRRVELLGRIGQLDRSAARKSYWADHPWLAGNAPPQQDVETARRELARLTRDREVWIRTIADGRSRAEQARTMAAGHRAELPDLAELPRLPATVLAAAADATRIAEADRDAHLQKIAEEESGITALESQRAAALQIVRNHEDQAVKSQEELVANLAGWRTMSLTSDEPDLEAIRSLEARLDQLKGIILDATVRLNHVRAARLAWERQQAHRQLLGEMRERLDLARESPRDTVRSVASERLERLRAREAATVRAHDIARAASATIRQRLSDFDSEYLEPLNVLTERIGQAILADPRVGIGFDIKRNEVTQSAKKDGVLPDDLGPIDPNLVHSEGQMAAIAVSMLCAASVIFPWSSWRALILDDPLQHNDAIHAAAFADLIVNLVKARGYQVLLTTHDRAQAEFLERKLRANGVVSSQLRLLGLGKDGVEWHQTNRPANSDPHGMTA